MAKWIVADSLYCPEAMFCSHLDSFSHYLREYGEEAFSVELRAGLSKKLGPVVDDVRPDVLFMLDHYGLAEESDARVRVAMVASMHPVMPWDVKDANGKPIYSGVVSSILWMAEASTAAGVPGFFQPLAFDTRARVCGMGVKRDLGCIFIGTTGPNHKRRTELLAELADVVTVLPPVFGREYFKTLARAKVVLNVHAEWSRGAANNMRLYESAGMGAKVVSDGMPRHPGDQFWMRWDDWNRPTDVIKIREAVAWATERDAHVDEPERTAEEAVLTDHTYENRIPALVEWVRSL